MSRRDDNADEVRSLTRAMRRADEDAWRRFHESYYDLLEAVARARGVDEGELADVIQRCYLRVLRHVRPFEEEEGFRAWLCCLMRSEVIDHARGRQRRAGLMAKLREWISGSEMGATRSATLLEGMAAPERRLLELHYVEGWSQAELAAEAGISAKAMESKLARLRQRARRWLTEGEGGAR